MILGYLGVQKVNIRVLIRGRQEVREERRCCVAGFEDGEIDHKPRQCLETGKGKGMNFLLKA